MLNENIPVNYFTALNLIWYWNSFYLCRRFSKDRNSRKCIISFFHLKPLFQNNFWWWLMQWHKTQTSLPSFDLSLILRIKMAIYETWINSINSTWTKVHFNNKFIQNVSKTSIMLQSKGNKREILKKNSFF